MFFKKAKRIKELEAQVTELEMQLEQASEEIRDLYMKYEYDHHQMDEPDYSEPCSCGGKLLPMYDEHPNWIKFCTTCDSRTENIDFSPIVEPA